MAMNSMIGGLGALSSDNQGFASQVGDTSAYWDPKGMGGTAGAGAGMGGGGGWLMPALGIGLKILGMFGGKKTQGVLAGHNAGLAIGGLAGALLGSNNPFAPNTTDKDKDKDETIGGNNNLQALGILGQAPLGAVGNAFGVGSMFS